MSNIQKYPIGLQSFKEVITGDYVYVDKTEKIYKLATENKYYFLSRPRRFGKSLLCSTLHALYSGQESLFKGLWIENSWDFENKNPVIFLNFDTISSFMR